VLGARLERVTDARLGGAVVGRGRGKINTGKRERVAPHLANRETIGKIGMGEGRGWACGAPYTTAAGA